MVLLKHVAENHFAEQAEVQENSSGGKAVENMANENKNMMKKNLK